MIYLIFFFIRNGYLSTSIPVSMKNSKDLPGVEVWLDKSKAVLSMPGHPEKIIEEIYPEPDTPEAGSDSDYLRIGGYRSTNDEYGKHQRERERTQSFFKSIVQSVTPYQKIFLTGPGTLHSELYHVMQDLPLFKNRWVELMSLKSPENNSLQDN